MDVAKRLIAGAVVAIAKAKKSGGRYREAVAQKSYVSTVSCNPSSPKRIKHEVQVPWLRCTLTSATLTTKEDTVTKNKGSHSDTNTRKDPTPSCIGPCTDKGRGKDGRPSTVQLALSSHGNPMLDKDATTIGQWITTTAGHVVRGQSRSCNYSGRRQGWACEPNMGTPCWCLLSKQEYLKV